MPSRVVRTTLLAASLLLTSCHRDPTPTIDTLARAYVRLAVALGERDKESLDYFYGPEAWVADVRTNPPAYKVIRQSALDLETQLQKLHPAKSWQDPTQQQRINFLLRQLRALTTRIDVLTVTQQQPEMPFDQETEGVFGIKAPTDINRLNLKQVRAQIDQLLPGTGTPTTSLATRYDTFDQKFTIPPALVPAVMARAIAGCRQITAAHIPLPPGESTALEYVTNEPWSAFSTYKGDLHSLLQVNTAFSLTVDRALQLACHEGYPGHHVFNSTRDFTLVRTTHWPELTVQTTFSPQSLISESAAVYATQMAFTDPERLAFERDILFPIAHLDPTQAEKYLCVARLLDQLHTALPSIARGYLDGKLEFVLASDALQDETLMAHTKDTLLYINEYRSYVLTYTYGVDLIQRYVEGPDPTKSTPTDRWTRYHNLMTQPDIDPTRLTN